MQEKKTDCSPTYFAEIKEEVQAFPKVEVSLDFGFRVLYGGFVEDLSFNHRQGHFVQLYTYDHIEIRKNDIVIYASPNNRIEYELGDSVAEPFVLQTGDSRFEIFLPTNDRRRGSTRRFFVVNNEVVKQDTLPGFISMPKYLSDDGVKRLAGFSLNGVPGDEGFVSFQPILYFSLTENGVVFDSIFTNKKNEMIFEGFESSIVSWDPLGKIIIERFNNEVNRIRNLE